MQTNRPTDQPVVFESLKMMRTKHFIDGRLKYQWNARYLGKILHLRHFKFHWVSKSIFIQLPYQLQNLKILLSL